MKTLPLFGFLFLAAGLCSAAEPATTAQIEILQKAAGLDHVKDYLAPDSSVTPEGLKLIAEYQAQTKTEPGAGAPPKVPPVKGLDAAAALPGASGNGLFDGAASGPAPLFDADIQNGRLNRATISKADGSFSGELGQLYTSGLYPQAAPSWYGNLTWNTDRNLFGLVDYHSSQSLGYADVNARYFAPPPLPQAQTAVGLAQTLGASPGIVDKLRGAVTYNDPYESQGMVVASALTQVGRAYRLLDPFDVSWTVGNLTRFLYAVPTSSLDGTLAVRARLPGDGSVGLFAGRTENVSPIGPNLMRQEVLGAGGASVGIVRNDETHLGVGYWSPGVSATVSRSRSETLSSQNANATVTPAAGDGSLSFVADYSRDRGTSFAYDDKRIRGEIDKQITPKASVYMGYQREQIAYGNASVGAGGWQIGFRAMLGDSARVTVENIFGKRYSDAPAPMPSDAATIEKINRDIATAIAAVQKAAQLGQELQAFQGRLQAAEAALQGSQLSAAQIQGDLAALSQTITSNPELTSQLIAAAQKADLTSAQKSALGGLLLISVPAGAAGYQPLKAEITAALGAPATAASLLGLQSRGASAINGALGSVNGAVNSLVAASGKVDAAAAALAKNQGDIERVVDMLANSQMWDAMVVQAARSEIVNTLNGVAEPVKVLGRTFTVHLDAPVILAAANVLRGSPVAPVTPSDVASLLLQQAGASLGVQGTVTDQALLQKVYGTVDAQIEAQITRALQPLLNANLPPPQAVAQLLSSLPPPAARALTAQFGKDLSSLVTADTTAAQFKQILLGLPAKAVAALNNAVPEAGLRADLDQALLGAGALISHQINDTIANDMLAAGEFDRMTVDHGRRVDQLDMRMSMASFDALSSRERSQAAAKAAELGARLRDAGE